MNEISRRSLLKTTGAAMGAVAAGTVVSAALADEVAPSIKVKLVACSPTGTAMMCGYTLAQYLSDDIEVFDQTSYLSRQEEVEFAADDLVIMIAPTYGGRIPITDNLFTNLKGNNTPCIAACAFGNRACEMGVQEIADIATANGFNVVGGIAMVTDHTSGGVLGRGRPNIDDHKVIKEFADTIKEKIASGDPQPAEVIGNPGIYEKYPPGVIFPSSATKVYWPDRCTHCLTCANECTVGAIDFETLFIDNEKCNSCQRCTVVCPFKARYFFMDRSFENKDAHNYWAHKDIDIYL